MEFLLKDQLVFAPLRLELGEVKDLFISPDGNLSLIPFEVLVDPEGRFLIEEYTFNYLAASRDLLGFGAIQEEGNLPVLIGDPDFDLALLPISTPPRPFDKLRTPQSQDRLSPTPYPPQKRTPPDLSQKRKNLSSSGFHFKRLPGTRAEVEGIQRLLGAQHVVLYTDQEAREAVLVHHASPRILHLATHGFFLEDQDLSAFVSPMYDDALAFNAIRARPKIVKEKLAKKQNSDL
jgi:CHAT domain-containing protein